MPLPLYGVVIGSFAGFTRDPQHDFGHWYHGHLRVSAPAGTYEAALDVDAPSSVGVSYRLVTDLTVADIATVRALPDGSHLLASTPTSGALDFVRSPLLRNSFWWAAKRATTHAYRLYRRPRPGEPVYGPDLADELVHTVRTLGRFLPAPVRDPLRHLRWRYFAWRPSDGDNALDALEPYVTASVRLYVFGQRFATGLGVHDVHQNQGDPLGSQWYPDNGVWQDGAVMAEQPDGSAIVWQVKFNTQAFDTDGDGHPY
jgi:uncharacterized protein DUF2278